MLFEIVNQSDPCTLEAPDFELACVACVALGEGAYGLREVGGDKEMPIMAFFNEKETDEWFRSRFGRSTESVFGACFEGRPKELVAALNSVLLGTVKDRECYKAAMDAIPEQAGRDAFKETWHDKHRSSMNDICSRAWTLAAHLKA